MLASENPADMAVDEALMARRMHVVFGVRMQMVVPMFGGPPQHALLGGALREKREDELKHPAGRIGAVREIAMISGLIANIRNQYSDDAYGDRLPGHAGPDRRDAAEMDQRGMAGRTDT